MTCDHDFENAISYVIVFDDMVRIYKNGITIDKPRGCAEDFTTQEQQDRRLLDKKMPAGGAG